MRVNILCVDVSSDGAGERLGCVRSCHDISLNWGRVVRQNRGDMFFAECRYISFFGVGRSGRLLNSRLAY